MNKPKIICLCGSTRFSSYFRNYNFQFTIKGMIVLSIGCDTKSDEYLKTAGELTDEMKSELDELHLRKIDISDEIFVLNVGGYIGESTRNEINYALWKGKYVKFLETVNVNDIILEYQKSNYCMISLTYDAREMSENQISNF